MSRMYEDCFGSCGHPMLLCPNCVCLKGPDQCSYYDDGSLKNIKYVYFSSPDESYNAWEENAYCDGIFKKQNYGDDVNTSINNNNDDDDDDDNDDDDDTNNLDPSKFTI
jgi:hypothetical protein